MLVLLISRVVPNVLCDPGVTKTASQPVVENISLCKESRPPAGPTSSPSNMKLSGLLGFLLTVVGPMSVFGHGNIQFPVTWFDKGGEIGR